MGLFFKVSQAIQSEFKSKLKRTSEAPEDFLHELIEDLERQEIELKSKRENLLEMQKREEAGTDMYEKLGEKLEKMNTDIKNLEQKKGAAKSRYDFYLARQKRLDAHRKLNEAMSEIDDVSRYDVIKGRHA